MAISFRIKRLADGRWVPNHADVASLVAYSDDGVSTRQDVKRALFATVDAKVPGVYVLSDDDLDDVREERFTEIDAKTFAEIEAGFPFRGVVFSLSLYAQSRYSGMLLARESLDYPLKFNSLDDLSSVTLEGPDDVVAFYGAGVEFVRQKVDAGTLLKERVRSATTQEELDAVQDTR